MVCDDNGFEQAIPNGIDLGSNAFMLVHGWTTVRLLLDFVARFYVLLERRALSLEDLAAETGAEEGPLAIVLRTCRILGYLAYDASSQLYSLVKGPELNDLSRILAPKSPVAQALMDLYSDLVPPFEATSDDAIRSLQVWEQHRPSWASIRSKGLAILLDGAILAPILTSVTYFARWDGQGMEKANTNDHFDLSCVAAAQRLALEDIFEQLGVGTVTAKNVLALSPKGATALQRCYSFYVPVSYAPMMSQFSNILLFDAGWGFADSGVDSFDVEEHVDRILNVIGSGVQHRTLFKDFMQHIDDVFKGEDFDSQPKFVVDTGCGDGALLMHIYRHIQQNLPRGQVLQDFPLTLVGIDLNEEPRVTTAVNLSKAGFPNIVISGDVGKPAELVATLKKKKVDMSKVLHVRSFLDHDRPHIPASRELQGNLAAFAEAQLADFVHLDRQGARIPHLRVFASLLEHFERWARVLDSGFGLCVLEVMMLDTDTTRRFCNDSVALSLDVVQCMSRQYLVSAQAFVVAAAMAGLLPADYKAVRAYPEHGMYCRMLAQRLTKKAFSVRLAELEDLPALMELEELAWSEDMRASYDVLEKRLRFSPFTNLVAEVGDQVVAVLYMQRIEDLSIVATQQFVTMSSACSPSGRILQLIATASRVPGIGYELKEFALHLARLDSSLDGVVGVTRCGEFQRYRGSLADYVDEHFSGKRADSTLAFHSSAGARFLRLLPGFRPEDVDNGGTGVLIAYDLKGTLTSLPSEPRTDKSSHDLVTEIMAELGYPADLGSQKGFYEYGMDSLELVRIRDKLNGALGLQLPISLLIDFPTVQALISQIDSERKLAMERAAVTEQSKDGEDGEDGKDFRSFRRLSSARVVEIYQRFNRTYALPRYQARLQDLAKQCYPDKFKYALALDDILMEVEGPILQESGLIGDLDFDTVQSGREQMLARAAELLSEKEVKRELRKLAHATKQDQVWT